MHIQPLGQSELEYFMQGGFAALDSFRVVDDATNETLARSSAFSLSGGGGILKRLKTQSEWVIIPYTLPYLTRKHLGNSGKFTV